jgi:predicted metal-binding protein
VKTHRMEITSDEIVRRGRRIRYRCPDCSTHGDLTMCPPAGAIELFELLAEVHATGPDREPT